MKIKTLSILLVGLFLISCRNNPHTSEWHGISGIGYQYDIPGNFDYCGREAIDDFSFTEYCFEDFRAMSRCMNIDIKNKNYSDCDFQASIQVEIKPISPSTNIDDILNQMIQSRFPDYAVSFLTIKRGNDDLVVAEIQSHENSHSRFPVYMTVLPHRNDHFAVITGQTDESGQSDKTWTAFEILAKSYEPVYIPAGSSPTLP